MIHMLVHLRYEPGLLDEVVRIELRRRETDGDLQLLRDYHHRADPLYRLSPERRENEFAALHLALFRELGFEGRIVAALDEHPTVLAQVQSLTFHRALRAEEEGADLGPATGGARPAVVRLRAAWFLSGVGLPRFLDHELTHLGDLLSPEFAHEPDALLAIPPHRRRPIQERYRVAWAISVDGRLSRRGKRPLAERAERRQELARCFRTLPGAELERLLAKLWQNDHPTHAQLMAIATSPSAAASQQPGAPCPLCGFPTHRWADPSNDALIRAIHLDVPAWRADEGLCERCFELYEMRPASLA